MKFMSFCWFKVHFRLSGHGKDRPDDAVDVFQTYIGVA